MAPYKPSLIVHSGHGLQIYWLFKELAGFHTKDDREAFSRLCRGWQQLFQQAGRDQGWHVDSTADLARVLRIPGTYNLKTDEAREVTVREANDFRYDPSDFSDFAEPDTSPKPRIPTSSNGYLDLCSLRVSPRIKYLIRHGDTIGQYPSPSEALFAVLMALLGCRLRRSRHRPLVPAEKARHFGIATRERPHLAGAGVKAGAPQGEGYSPPACRWGVSAGRRCLAVGGHGTDTRRSCPPCTIEDRLNRNRSRACSPIVNIPDDHAKTAITTPKS